MEDVKNVYIVMENDRYIVGAFTDERVAKDFILCSISPSKIEVMETDYGEDLMNDFDWELLDEYCEYSLRYETLNTKKYL